MHAICHQLHAMPWRCVDWCLALTNILDVIDHHRLHCSLSGQGGLHWRDAELQAKQALEAEREENVPKAEVSALQQENEQLQEELEGLHAALKAADSKV